MNLPNRVGYSENEYIGLLKNLLEALSKENQDLREREAKLQRKVEFYEKNYVPRGAR